MGLEKWKENGPRIEGYCERMAEVLPKELRLKEERSEKSRRGWRVKRSRAGGSVRAEGTKGPRADG